MNDRHLSRLQKPDLGLGLGCTLSQGGISVPALNLDFINSSALDSRITFTRGSSGTRVNSSGLIETITTNNPRFDYDPVTLAAKGLLIEEARTNLQIRSDAIVNGAGWSVNSCTFTADAATAPDGATTADLVKSAAATALTGASGSVTVTAAAQTWSIFVKQATGVRYVQLMWAGAATTDYADFDLQLGTLTAGTYTAASITSYGNGWYRISMTSTTAAGTYAQYVIAIPANNSARATSFVGDGTAGFYAWGGQVELGSFPTSYIPTVASTVTRSADVASMTGASFSNWWNALEGTFVLNADTAETSGQNSICIASDGTANNCINNWSSDTTGKPQYTVLSGAASQADMTGPSAVAANTAFKVATTYKANDFYAAENGTIFTTPDTSGTVPTVDRLHIGTRLGTARWLNGHIRRIAYYRKRLANATLQSLTA